MDKLVERFVEHLRAKGGVPVSTVAAYRSDLRQFARFLAEQHGYMGTTVGVEEMRAFCAWLEGVGYAPASIARRVTSLRAFGAFLVASGRAAVNPGDALTPPRRPRPEKNALTSQQIEALCNTPLHKQAPEGWRDCALLYLITTTRLRASDLVALDVTHLDLEKAALYLPHGRRFALPPQTVMALVSYLTLGRPRLLRPASTETALFLNGRGRRLTRQGCWVVVKQHARALDLVDVSLERLRLPLALAPS